MKKAIVMAVACTSIIASGVALSHEKSSFARSPAVVSSIPSEYKLVKHLVDKNRDVYAYEKKQDQLNYERYLVSGFSGPAQPDTNNFVSTTISKMEKVCPSGFSSYEPESGTGVSAGTSFVTKCDNFKDGSGVAHSVVTALKYSKNANSVYEVKWFKYSEPSSGELTSAEKELAMKALGEVNI